MKIIIANRIIKNKIRCIKSLSAYLLKNRGRIISVDMTRPILRLIQTSSNGNEITIPTTDEIITIKLKPMRV